MAIIGAPPIKEGAHPPPGAQPPANTGGVEAAQNTAPMIMVNTKRTSLCMNGSLLGFQARGELKPMTRHNQCADRVDQRTLVVTRFALRHGEFGVVVTRFAGRVRPIRLERTTGRHSGLWAFAKRVLAGIEASAIGYTAVCWNLVDKPEAPVKARFGIQA